MFVEVCAILPRIDSVIRQRDANPLSTVTSTSVAVGGVYGWMDWVDDWWLFRCVIRRFCVFEGLEYCKIRGSWKQLVGQVDLCCDRCLMDRLSGQI